MLTNHNLVCWNVIPWKLLTNPDLVSPAQEPDGGGRWQLPRLGNEGPQRRSVRCEHEQQADTLLQSVRLPAHHAGVNGRTEGLHARWVILPTQLSSSNVFASYFTLCRTVRSTASSLYNRTSVLRPISSGSQSLSRYIVFPAISYSSPWSSPYRRDHECFTPGRFWYHPLDVWPPTDQFLFCSTIAVWWNLPLTSWHVSKNEIAQLTMIILKLATTSYNLCQINHLHSFDQ